MLATPFSGRHLVHHLRYKKATVMIAHFAFIAVYACCSFVILGCQNGGGDPSSSGNCSYAEHTDGSLYYTTSYGDILVRNSDGQDRLLKSANKSWYSDIDLSSDGRRILAVQQPYSYSDQSQVVVFSINEDGELTEQFRFSGKTPRFSSDDKTLFFARANRFVPQFGIGGNFWTDISVFQMDLESQVTEEVVDDRFVFLNDLAPDLTNSRVLISGTKNDGTDDVVENIFVGDIKTGVAKKINAEGTGHVIAGNPDISDDGKQVLFVSDRNEEFHYWLFTADAAGMKAEVLEASTKFRINRNPSFSKTSQQSVLSLCSDYSAMAGGKPLLELRRFFEGGSEVVISSASLNESWKREKDGTLGSVTK